MAKLVVCGSMILDFVIRAPRIPAIGETLIGLDFAQYPGGKGANQAVAASRAGAETLMVGACGQDQMGTDLQAFLSENSVSTVHVKTDKALPTGVAMITVNEDGENAITIAPGANGTLTEGEIDAVPLSAGDVVLAQMEVPPAAIARLFDRARGVGARTVLNVAPADEAARPLLPLSDVLIVNEVELSQLAGVPVDLDDRDNVAQAARSLRGNESQIIVATLGSHGVHACAGPKDWWLPAHKVDAIDTTGAGDCFSGVLAAALLAGEPLEIALERANHAASLCVTKPGAGPSMPHLSELIDQ